MPLVTDLPMDKECLYSGLPMATCAHCRGDSLDDIPLQALEGDFEVTRYFIAQFSGTCAIDRSHRIKKGDRIGFVRHADNPNTVVTGAVCKTCTSDLPRARQ